MKILISKNREVVPHNNSIRDVHKTLKAYGYKVDTSELRSAWYEYSSDCGYEWITLDILTKDIIHEFVSNIDFYFHSYTEGDKTSRESILKLISHDFIKEYIALCLKYNLDVTINYHGVHCTQFPDGTTLPFKISYKGWNNEI